MAQSEHSPHVLHFSVNEALTLAARILSFTNASHYSIPNAARERQIELFFSDIVMFALHVRKVGEITGIRPNQPKLTIIPEAQRTRRGHEDPNIVFENKFWTIADRLIHSKKLHVVEENTQQDHPDMQVLDCILDARHLLFRFCLVESDRPPMCQFLIESFVLTFVEKIWPSEECQTHLTTYEV